MVKKYPHSNYDVKNLDILLSSKLPNKDWIGVNWRIKDVHVFFWWRNFIINIFPVYFKIVVIKIYQRRAKIAPGFIAFTPHTITILCLFRVESSQYNVLWISSTSKSFPQDHHSIPDVCQHQKV